MRSTYLLLAIVSREAGGLVTPLSASRRSRPTMALSNEMVIGVDVGTQSARAGLFTLDGQLVRSSSEKITTYRNEQMVEQSADEIWRACCKCVNEIVQDEVVIALAFDATCSLVVVDKKFEPLRVSESKDRNIVVWMDHRATEQATRITRIAPDSILRSVGGAVSPEMELPKICWLFEKFGDAEDWIPGQFFDLTDYLSWRATGNLARSLCTVVCKWNYQQDGWDRDFLQSIGLPPGVEHLFGTNFLPPGNAIGPLTPTAALELGLSQRTIVAAGAIDAHAGGLGCIGYRGLHNETYIDRLALVAGTSACHMASSLEPIYVPGVWGPYPSAMVPGSYLTEGGQSAAGALFDYLKANVLPTDATFDEIFEQLECLRHHRKLPDVALLAKHVHVDPDVNGNRSPLADPDKRAAVLGLSINDPPQQRAAVLYLAACQALAYQTRHIVEAITKHRPSFSQVVVCGGLANNRLYLQQHASASPSIFVSS